MIIFLIISVFILVVTYYFIYGKVFSKRDSTYHRDNNYTSFDGIDVDASLIVNVAHQKDNSIYYMAIDTETIDVVHDDPACPNLPIAISWQLLDKNCFPIEEKSYILKQSTIYKEAIRIHGIDYQKSIKGCDPKEVILNLLCDMEKVNAIVAHNLNFHLSVIVLQLNFLKIQNQIPNKTMYCTMEWTIQQGFKRNSKGEALYMSLPQLFAKLYFERYEIPIKYTSKTIRDVRLLSACLRQMKSMNLF